MVWCRRSSGSSGGGESAWWRGVWWARSIDGGGVWGWEVSDTTESTHLRPSFPMTQVPLGCGDQGPVPGGLHRRGGQVRHVPAAHGGALPEEALPQGPGKRFFPCVYIYIYVCVCVCVCVCVPACPHTAGRSPEEAPPQVLLWDGGVCRPVDAMSTQPVPDHNPPACLRPINSNPHHPKPRHHPPACLPACLPACNLTNPVSHPEPHHTPLSSSTFDSAPSTLTPTPPPGCRRYSTVPDQSIPTPNTP